MRARRQTNANETQAMKIKKYFIERHKINNRLKETHQKEIFALAKKYNSSKNFWERRLSLVLVEWYTREPSLHAEIKKLVKPLENDPEYYVRKAVVWINKNFMKGK